MKTKLKEPRTYKFHTFIMDRYVSGSQVNLGGIDDEGNETEDDYADLYGHVYGGTYQTETPEEALEQASLSTGVPLRMLEILDI